MNALRTSLERVLGEVQRRHGDEVDLTADAYWVLPAKHAYGQGGPPPAEVHTLGSLVDDLKTVRELATEDREAVGAAADVVVWHDLAHLIGVLQRLAALDLPDGPSTWV